MELNTNTSMVQEIKNKVIRNPKKVEWHYILKFPNHKIIYTDESKSNDKPGISYNYGRKNCQILYIGVHSISLLSRL